MSEGDDSDADVGRNQTRTHGLLLDIRSEIKEARPFQCKRARRALGQGCLS
jgi:cobalamin biosynthesis protein CobT